MTHDQAGGPPPQTWLPEAAPDPVGPSPEQLPPYTPPETYAPPDTYAPPATYPSATPYPSPTPYPGPMPYPPGAYAPMRPSSAPVPQRTPVLAVVGLVLAFLAPLVGLVVSIVALVRAPREGNGRGIAIAGVVLSVAVTPVYAAVAIPVFLNQRELAQEAGPRDAFHRVTTAFADGDCDRYLASSTLAFQRQFGATTCEQFSVFVERLDPEAVGVGDVPVTGVEVDGDVATVTTRERVVWADGQAPTVEEFEYRMVQRDGDWLLDGVALAD